MQLKQIQAREKQLILQFLLVNNACLPLCLSLWAGVVPRCSSESDLFSALEGHSG